MDEQTQSSGVSPSTPISSPHLSVGSIISNGFSLGFRNFFPLIGAFILWLITIWIPYLNVGATVGLYALVVKMSRGEKFSPVEIFDSSYRQIFPEFFLLLAIEYIGIFIGYVFFIIPGLILSIVWCISYFLLIDNGMGVLESLKSSSKATYEFKWDIFGGLFIIMIIFAAILLLVIWLFRTTQTISPLIGSILFLFMFMIFGLIFYAVYWGAYAHIYKELSNRT